MHDKPIRARRLLQWIPPCGRSLAFAAKLLSAVAVVVLLLPIPAGAGRLDAGLLRQGTAAIASPQAGDSVQGAVTITGTAVHSQFQRYELYYTIEPGENWVFIGEAAFQQVQNGPLGTWNTSALPDGTYSLRLRVVRQDGNYDEAYQRNITVANTTPSTPTPTPTEFAVPTLPAIAEPTAPPTPEATATPLTIEQPEIPTPTPRPSPTPTAEQIAPEVDQVDDDGGFFQSVLDFDALRGSFAEGLTYAGSIFLAVGAFFGIKKLLLWLWYLIAP